MLIQNRLLVSVTQDDPRSGTGIDSSSLAKAGASQSAGIEKDGSQVQILTHEIESLRFQLLQARAENARVLKTQRPSRSNDDSSVASIPVPPYMLTRPESLAPYNSHDYFSRTRMAGTITSTVQPNENEEEEEEGSKCSELENVQTHNPGNIAITHDEPDSTEQASHLPFPKAFVAIDTGSELQDNSPDQSISDPVARLQPVSDADDEPLLSWTGENRPDNSIVRRGVEDSTSIVAQEDALFTFNQFETGETGSLNLQQEESSIIGQSTATERDHASSSPASDTHSIPCRNQSSGRYGEVFEQLETRPLDVTNQSMHFDIDEPIWEHTDDMTEDSRILRNVLCDEAIAAQIIPESEEVSTPAIPPTSNEPSKQNESDLASRSWRSYPKIRNKDVSSVTPKNPKVGRNDDQMPHDTNVEPRASEDKPHDMPDILGSEVQPSAFYTHIEKAQVTTPKPNSASFDFSDAAAGNSSLRHEESPEMLEHTAVAVQDQTLPLNLELTLRGQPMQVTEDPLQRNTYNLRPLHYSRKRRRSTLNISLPASKSTLDGNSDSNKATSVPLFASPLPTIRKIKASPVIPMVKRPRNNSAVRNRLSAHNQQRLDRELEAAVTGVRPNATRFKLVGGKLLPSKCGSFFDVRHLLEQGANPNHSGYNGRILNIEMENLNRTNVIDLLEQYGAEPN
jgi:hypothetical protein